MSIQPLDYQPFISSDEFRERLSALHLRAWASEPYDFDTVMRRVYEPPEDYVLVDPFVLHDGSEWHLFYVTGRLSDLEAWRAGVADEDASALESHPYEGSEAHASGESLYAMVDRGRIYEVPAGEYESAGRVDSCVFAYGESWLDLYTSKSATARSLSIARSRDLSAFERQTENPVWTTPEYGEPGGKCSGAFVVRFGVPSGVPFDGRYLVYYMLTLRNGGHSIALLSTENFRDFADHGPVIVLPPSLRGTMSVESPCVIQRNGVWHLFFGWGPGFWHSMSIRPDCFSEPMHMTTTSCTGVYFLGPFHAARIVQGPEGDWIMVATRKEEARRRARISGESIARGSKADEGFLRQGLFACTLRWDGDFPILEPYSKGSNP